MWKDSETEIDYLDYDYLIESIEDIVMNDNLLPASIGVYGDWGSGKSTLMRMVKKRIEYTDEKAKCIYFNGWLFESYEDAKTALLSSIIDEINKDERFGDKIKDVVSGLNESVDKFKLAQIGVKAGIDFFSAGVMSMFTGVNLANVIPALLSGVINSNTETVKDLSDSVREKLDKKELREDIRKFQENFCELIEKSKMSRLVVFIDELDRCRPDTILDTLEAMKLFMFTGKVVFVIGADERHIAYAVKSKFADIEGIQIDIGKEYMEKLIQYPIRIPRMDIFETENYIASLLLEKIFEHDTITQIMQDIRNENKDRYFSSDLPYLSKDERIKSNDYAKSTVIIAEQISGILSAGAHGNPRQVKRFLNVMDMRLKQAEYKKIDLDRGVLLKLMLLEYIKAPIFSKFAELNAKNKLKEELEYLEADNKDEKVEFQLSSRLKDEWFENWLSLEPKLSDCSLSAYFYFARTSLDEKISRISSILSPNDQQILAAIINESEIILEKTLEYDISDIDVSNIIDGFSINVRNQSKISKEKIDYFTRFVLRHNDVKQDAIDCIKDFTYKQMELGSLMYLAKFAAEVGEEDQVHDIVKKWDSECGKDRFVKPYEKALKAYKEK